MWEFPANYGGSRGARGARILALLYFMMGIVGRVYWRVQYGTSILEWREEYFLLFPVQEELDPGSGTTEGRRM